MRRSGRCLSNYHCEGTCARLRPRRRVRVVQPEAHLRHSRRLAAENNMKATQVPAPALSSNHNNAHESKWHGHMADDVGATYGHEPMATLTATGDALLLSGTRGTFRIPRAAVTKLGRGNMYPWLFSAVRIHHTVAGYPTNLQFKPLGMRPRDVRAHLRTLGYPVA
jgi:hypothetical protein